MGISVKLLSLLSTTLTITALLPGIATAQSSPPPSGPTKATSVNLNKLPEAQRAEVQSLLRQRTEQIVEVLDENQKSKFYDGLRKRHKLTKALEDLNLTPEQESRINSIINDYNNKITAVTTGQPLQPTQQQAPPTTP
jgi:Spy/CpxP family protein refolding chaperone